VLDYTVVAAALAMPRICAVENRKLTERGREPQRVSSAGPAYRSGNPHSIEFGGSNAYKARPRPQLSDGRRAMSLTKPVKAVLIGTVTVGLLAPMSGAVLSASSRRSVTGTVTDRSGAILEGAVVQLKDLLTLNIRSYITQSDGLYRFHGLHPDIDYELTAAYQGRSSRSRTLSRFNSNSNVRIDLQIPNGDTHVLGGRTSGDTILNIEAGGT